MEEHRWNWKNLKNAWRRDCEAKNPWRRNCGAKNPYLTGQIPLFLQESSLQIISKTPFYCIIQATSTAPDINPTKWDRSFQRISLQFAGYCWTPSTKEIFAVVKFPCLSFSMYLSRLTNAKISCRCRTISMALKMMVISVRSGSPFSARIRNLADWGRELLPGRDNFSCTLRLSRIQIVRSLRSSLMTQRHSIWWWGCWKFTFGKMTGDAYFQLLKKIREWHRFPVWHHVGTTVLFFVNFIV